MTAGRDLLRGATWRCAEVAPGTELTATQFDDLDWMEAQVPGTAAAAVRAGDGDSAAHGRGYDDTDWWFVARVPVDGAEGPLRLEADGLATLSEVWVDGSLRAAGESMFAPLAVDIPDHADTVTVALRFASLTEHLRSRRPRGRWRSSMVAEQGLRWVRTTMLGRAPVYGQVPAPVGPWRPVRLLAGDAMVDRSMRAWIDGDASRVHLRAEIRMRHAPTEAQVWIGEQRTVVRLSPDPSGDHSLLDATVEVDGARPWWPHTHGEPVVYPVRVVVGELDTHWGTAGFRSVDLDTADDGFAIHVNGRRVFCRGACWVPPDPVRLVAEPDELRRTLTAVRDAGLNMLRVTGTLAYEQPEFWELCAELGILVWQDVMLATVDPPADERFEDLLRREVAALAAAVGANPALTVVSGGSETEQQPTMVGLPAPDRTIRALDEVLPAAVRELLPGTPYLPSSPWSPPSSGELPTHVSVGVAHYFGVGGYRRPVSDVRSARVRFAAECLAFATPPERAAIEAAFGSAAAAGHLPAWKAAVPRDRGAPWDFEDVRDHYVRELFGEDPASVRHADPERYLDLGRAAVADAVSECLGYWRRRDSGCAGALVLALRDLTPGAGWGLLDSSGGPKAPWYALARAAAPTAVTLTEDGMDGIRVDVHHDGPARLDATLRIEAHSQTGAAPLLVEREISLPAHGSAHWSIDALIGRFTDVSYTHRFGPQVYHGVTATLHGPGGTELARDVRLPGPRPLENAGDVGLRAEAAAGPAGEWMLRVETTRAAAFVCVDATGWRAQDSWFHLAPGTSRELRLHPIAGAGRPKGHVRAVNSGVSAPITIRE
ncbi:glycosyl hydrolase 2 galactose-binding domain-containing protein [Rhodococcus daqingensis]|uniref:Beta-mannosidase-like galactose-binding domain-containing protein n=1 Tax=Rhodococcus daqingensis TaxID=2479363 RepID=A0ABW2RRX6_9NOCA